MLVELYKEEILLKKDFILSLTRAKTADTLCSWQQCLVSAEGLELVKGASS